MRITHKLLLAFMLIGLALGVMPACSAQSNAAHLNMTPMDKMPADVRSATVTVQQAYQFASANSDVMKNIPCYCGCGNIGHTSNYSCYVSAQDARGNIAFDNHALSCSICVDITQDVMRMLRDGKNPADIRVYVDTTYSKYGLSNTP